MLILNTTTQFFSESYWTGIGALATTVGAIATIIYTLITYRLFSKTEESIEVSNKVASFNTYLKISESLGTIEVDRISEACSKDNIIIVDEYPVNKESGKVYFLKNDVRRSLLGALEDIAKFERDGLITISDIDYAFGFLILNVGNGKAIVEFINELRCKHNYDNLYGGFEELYQKIRDRLDENSKISYRENFNSPVI